MFSSPLRFALTLVLATYLLFVCGCSGCNDRDVDTLTQHQDNARTGQYLNEMHLTPASITSPDFGYITSRAVDGDVYAQVLYVNRVPTKRYGARNLIFVATENNTVYAIDLDNLSQDENAGKIFTRQLQPTGSIFVCPETPSGKVGITATPVIDKSTYTMYVVARNAVDHQYYLHALDLTDNFVDRHAPVKIQGGDANTTFNAECARNRPGLLLQDGTLYIGFASLHCDQPCPFEGAYHGWVFAYRATDLAQEAVFSTSSGSTGAGIWQSGNGLVGYGNNFVYFETGNGPGPYGDSFVKLERKRLPLGITTLTSPAHFTPLNAVALNIGDTDLGSGGPALLPGGLLIGGGKQGRYYVMDAANMALTQNSGPTPPGNYDGFQAFYDTYHNTLMPTKCLFTSPPAGCEWNPEKGAPAACYLDPKDYQVGEWCGPNIHAGPVVWTRAADDHALIYQMAEKDYVKAFRYDYKTHHVSTGQVLTGGIRPIWGMPGGFSTLSANDNHDGILWVNYPLGNAQPQYVPGALAAFDAATLSLLWEDNSWGYLHFAKFVPPTVADGRVIRVTWSGLVLIYGVRKSRWWAPLSPDRPKFSPFKSADGSDALKIKFKLAGDGRGMLRAPRGKPRQLEDGGWSQDYEGVVLGLASSNVSTKTDPKVPTFTCSRPPKFGTSFTASVYWNRRTGANIVMGQIRDLWLKLGGHAGRLGYPIADELPTQDATGRISHFEHGDIVWTMTGGAHLVEGQERRPVGN